MATKTTHSSLSDMPTCPQTLPISISYSIPPPFLSSIIVHTHRTLSRSFSSTILSLSSSNHLFGLSGRCWTSPFTHFNTLWSSSLSWASALINPTTSPIRIRIRIWIRIRIRIRIRIKGSTSLSYTNNSLSFSLSLILGSYKTRPVFLPFNSNIQTQSDQASPSHTTHIYHTSTLIDNLHSDRTYPHNTNYHNAFPQSPHNLSPTPDA